MTDSLGDDHRHIQGTARCLAPSLNAAERKSYKRQYSTTDVIGESPLTRFDYRDSMGYEALGMCQQREHAVQSLVQHGVPAQSNPRALAEVSFRLPVPLVQGQATRPCQSVRVKGVALDPVMVGHSHRQIPQGVV